MAKDVDDIIKEEIKEGVDFFFRWKKAITAHLKKK